jgi:hypothetical protein
MRVSARSSVVDAFVFHADVAALRLARLAAGRSDDAPGRPATAGAVTALRDRRKMHRPAVPPIFPGDAA